MKNTYRIYSFLCLIGLISLTFTSCQKPKEKVDLLVKNAKVYTVNEAFETQEAFAIKDGKFVAVGKQADLIASYEATETIDLQGLPVYPGLYDAHCHFYGLGQKLSSADLIGTSSYEEVIERVKAFETDHPELTESWIIGRGWDQNDWENKEFPTKAMLDEAFPDKPVLLTRVDGHAALVNQKALDLAKISATTTVEGGKVILVDGAPSGILIDNAVDLAEAVIPQPTDKQLEAMLLEAQERCLANGLTSLVDAGLRRNIIEKLESMHASGALKIRIYAMINPLDQEYYLNEKGTYQTDRLNVRSFKVYADGALGSRGAALIQPYADDPHNHGLVLTSATDMEALIKKAHAKGFQVNTHCIGDSANRLVLDLYSQTLAEGNDKRWRIEHAQVVEKQDLAKYGTFNIIPSVQPTHATSDMYWAGDRLGKERVKNRLCIQRSIGRNWLTCFWH